MDMKNVDELLLVSEKSRWQYFEELVASIFEANGFRVSVRKVIDFGKRKAQFDVLATNGRLNFAVECKRWRKHAKRCNLRSEARKHGKRCEYYANVFGEVIPVMVTIYDDGFRVCDNVFVVPIDKLNWFINHFDEIGIEEVRWDG